MLTPTAATCRWTISCSATSRRGRRSRRWTAAAASWRGSTARTSTPASASARQRYADRHSPENTPHHPLKIQGLAWWWRPLVADVGIPPEARGSSRSRPTRAHCDDLSKCPECRQEDDPLLSSSAGVGHLGGGGAEHSERGAGGLPDAACGQSLSRGVWRTKVGTHTHTH